MAHYLAEDRSISYLQDTYPYDPGNLAQSWMDYLEAKWDAGWELVSVTSRGSDSNWMFTFKANAQ